MILPTKHLPVGTSLLGMGATILTALDQPSGVTELWQSVRHEDGINSFDRFCSALVFLYVLGLIDLDPGDSMLRAPR